MSEARPIMCTLTAGELRDRGRAWQKVLASGLVRVERVPGGIRFHADPGAARALLQLVELERECCEWIDFDVEGDSVVTLTAAGDGEQVLAGMFVLPA